MYPVNTGVEYTEDMWVLVELFRIIARKEYYQRNYGAFYTDVQREKQEKRGLQADRDRLRKENEELQRDKATLQQSMDLKAADREELQRQCEELRKQNQEREREYRALPPDVRELVAQIAAARAMPELPEKKPEIRLPEPEAAKQPGFIRQIAQDLRRGRMPVADIGKGDNQNGE